MPNDGMQCSYIPSLPERVREPSMDYSSGQVRRSCSEHVSSIICDLFAPFKVTLHFDKLFYHFNEILVYINTSRKNFIIVSQDLSYSF